MDTSESGYIKLKKRDAAQRNLKISLLTKLGITHDSIIGILRKLHLDWIRKYIPVSFKSKLPSSSVEIDLKESLIYPGILFTGASQYLSINREKIRSEDEYEKLRNDIILKLSSLRDPKTGESVIEAVYKKEEVYSGPYLRDAPDIIFLLKRGYGLTTSLYLNSPIFEDIYSPFGTHHVDGIFLAYGPGIKRGYRIRIARIIDIVPTILHVFNLPIPNDMDGQVLKEIFEEDSEFSKRKPEYVDPNYYKQESERLKKAIKKLRKKF